MRYEVNARYYIIRYDRYDGSYEIIKYVTGTGKKNLEKMLNYYENERFPNDLIILAKGVKIQ